jgi:hypothetical protein
VSAVAGSSPWESPFDPATEEGSRGHDLEGQASLKYRWGETMGTIPGKENLDASRQCRRQDMGILYT